MRDQMNEAIRRVDLLEVPGSVERVETSRSEIRRIPHVVEDSSSLEKGSVVTHGAGDLSSARRDALDMRPTPRKRLRQFRL
ncbi:hypothetical protein GCM10009854_29290 [Saccharopolyspora halophila]|uniref:Uncharacterized protein n=1 Tax=Saccharopolyspora halophila TaxID=405551 RepID=A0ABN3GEB6_9PSEU